MEDAIATESTALVDSTPNIDSVLERIDGLLFCQLV
jgi:hypothetical protein